MEAQWKLRYSQEGLKKSTEKSRLAKSLLWFKQGTRPVVTSHFASEAWGWGGELLRRGLPTRLFSVFRLPSVSLLSLFQGLGGGKAGKAVLAYGALRCSTTRSSWSGRTPVSQVFGKCYFQQEFGKKTKAICYLKVRPYTFAWYGGRRGRWHLEPVWTGKKIHMGQYATWKLQEGITECSFKSVSVASNFLY